MIKSFSDLMNLLYNGYFLYTNENFRENLINLILVFAVCAICAYLIGSLNFSLILCRKKYGVDIRTQGSGNAGATNMLRTCGKKAAIYTFLGDVLKTSITVLFGYLMLGYDGAYFAGLFCIIGHAYPIYFGFKGGKGVVAISTVCFLTEPLVFVILLVIFIIILYGYQMVSLASIMTMLVYPMMLSMVGHKEFGFHIILAAFSALFVIFLHRKNIARIYNHTESKINLRKKKDKIKKSYKEDDE